MDNAANGKTYDLAERTEQFGKQIILFCNKAPRSPITIPLITQLVKCGTSVGANYYEADDAESKQDFRHKIGICKKEARESKYFIRMIVVAIPQLEADAKKLFQEAKEIHLIFNSIYKKVNT